MAESYIVQKLICPWNKMFYRKDSVIIEDKKLLEGVKDRAVAEAMGVSIPYISMVRNGRRVPSGPFYKRWVDVVAKLKNTP